MLQISSQDSFLSNWKFTSFNLPHLFHSCSYPSPFWQAHVLCIYEFFSVWLVVCFVNCMPHINKIILYLFPSVVFFSHSIISSRSIHVAANGKNLYFLMAEEYSIYLYHIFINSSMGGHFRLFPCLGCCK